MSSQSPVYLVPLPLQVAPLQAVNNSSTESHTLNLGLRRTFQRVFLIVKSSTPFSGLHQFLHHSSW